jgi:hypothetical protein
MGILNFTKFKVAVPKPKRKRNTDGVSRTSNKIIRGKVFQDENGTFKISIDMKNDPDYPDLLVLDFTERSYNLVGKTNVFSRTLDEKGRRTRFIRNESHAKFMPGLPEQYIPFAPNWIVRGYIVKEHGLMKFDFVGLVGVDGYGMDVLHPEDEE